jgi:hypothetical protein
MPAIDTPMPDMPGPDLPPEAPPARNALFVVGNTTLNAGDTQLRAALMAKGLTVRLLDDAAAPDTANTQLVVLSASCMAAMLANKYRMVALPVLNLESAVYDDMGMTGTTANDFDEAMGTQVVIVLPAHPLAAGLAMGNVTVVTASSGISWGVPGAAAEKVATIPGQATHFAVFAYPKDAAMVGLQAPGKRVGLFPSDTASQRLSPDGLKLLNAAIDWLLQ